MIQPALPPMPPPGAPGTEPKMDATAVAGVGLFPLLLQLLLTPEGAALPAEAGAGTPDALDTDDESDLASDTPSGTEAAMLGALGLGIVVPRLDDRPLRSPVAARLVPAGIQGAQTAALAGAAKGGEPDAAPRPQGDAMSDARVPVTPSAASTVMTPTMDATGVEPRLAAGEEITRATSLPTITPPATRDRSAVVVADEAIAVETVEAPAGAELIDRADVSPATKETAATGGGASGGGTNGWRDDARRPQDDRQSERDQVNTDFAIPGVSETRSAATTSRPDEIERTAAAPREILEQVLDRVQTFRREGRHEIAFRLDPPELGAVRIEAVLEGTRLSLTIRAERETARELLEQALPRLRESLAQQGLSTDRLSVDLGLDSSRREPSRDTALFTEPFAPAPGRRVGRSTPAAIPAPLNRGIGGIDVLV